MLLNISKKTKIVCTIGPASQTKEMILKLYASGMNVMRVNFSHGDHEEQLGKIKIARQLENEGIYLPVCLDTKGPEIRTGYMQKGGVPVQAGQRMKILMENVVGDEKQFSVTYSGLYEDVKTTSSSMTGNSIWRSSARIPTTVPSWSKPRTTIS